MSCWVRLWHGRMTDGIPGICVDSCGPVVASCWGGGLFDVLAGDLVVAGYAVGVDGEQDPHAASGAGSDFGGRGRPATATAQQTRRREAGRRVPPGRMAAARAWCQIRPVEALAKRAAAGTLEQLPVGGGHVGVPVMVQELDGLRGDRDCPAGAAGAVFEAAGLAWCAVSGPSPRGPGEGSGECQLSPAACGAGRRNRRAARRLRRGAAPRSTGSRRTRSAPGGSG